MTKASEIKVALKNLASQDRAETNAWFFKTGPGEYGHGDQFLGVRVPDIRRAIRGAHVMASAQVEQLLRSKYHEERLAGVLILVDQYKRGDDDQKLQVYRMYLEQTKYINNWDLVDLSAHKIVGPHLAERSKAPLTKLAKSASLWERRIAIIATFHYIRFDNHAETLRIAKILLKDSEDLIHKAVGWMLREVGKKDLAVAEEFLLEHYRRMPRTMLRYAIEKFPEAKRQAYLKGRM